MARSPRQKAAGKAVRQQARIAHIGMIDLDGGFRERRLAVADIDKVFGPGGTFCNVVNQWDVSDAVFGPGPFVGEAVWIDPASARPYPFESGAIMLLAEYTGDQAETVPRAVLRRQVECAAKLGVVVKTAFEFEWLVYDETAKSLRDKEFMRLTPWAVDNRCWDGLSAPIYAEPICELEALLRDGGIGLLGLGMELGPGCLEGTLAATDAIGAADEAALFKLYTKAFFRRRNQTAVFMSQPDANAPGLSGHIHLSLRDKRGRNLFYDADGPDCMSATMRHFIGGVLALLPDCLALPLHTVNAYRRLSPGNWAPRTATWSVQNYSTAIRAVTDNANLCRLEFRLPGADVHPHLALAMLLGTGLWGMEQRIEPPVPVISDGRVDVPVGTRILPHDLRLAAEALSGSKVAAGLSATHLSSGSPSRAAMNSTHCNARLVLPRKPAISKRCRPHHPHHSAG
ncbi:hypothetical protein ACFPL7_16550 [Dongia soli]|uniref:GS catalytic domain-containing protein n=1 Tax=Dongia soli TaxID=600628 RepID=A0ABU5EJY9_9PROT|nr:hypothetical protein [Dongia soli]MDY0885543.1 hypothetical protein [Dongia soli]